MRNFPELKEFLSQPRKIFITTHRKPDGDALGSSLALFHYFIMKGHEPVVVSPTDYGMYLHWMPGNPAVINWAEENETAMRHLNQAELVICLDFSQLQRVDDMGTHIAASTAKKVMIDHHLDPDEFAHFILWNPDASSTAELVYKFIQMMGDEKLVDKNIATCIYTGIVTDSGSFRYPSVTADVHKITAKLLEAGVEHSMVHRNVYDTFSEDRLKFFGHCISNKMVILHEYRAAYIAVSKEELKQFNIGTGDTEGLVNFPLNINEVIFVALIVERENIVKLSLRSKGNFPANEFSEKYFSGGGHLNAAGGRSLKSLNETIATFMKGLEEYKQLLMTS